MNRMRWIFIGLMAGALLTLGFILTAPSQDSMAAFSAADRADGNLFVVDPQIERQPDSAP